MMEACAVEDSFVMQFNMPYDNIELYRSYLRHVERDFTASVDDLLRQLGLSYLKVNSA
jgi:hypothetical protein